MHFGWWVAIAVFIFQVFSQMFRSMASVFIKPMVAEGFTTSEVVGPNALGLLLVGASERTEPTPSRLQAALLARV